MVTYHYLQGYPQFQGYITTRVPHACINFSFAQYYQYRLEFDINNCIFFNSVRTGVQILQFSLQPLTENYLKCFYGHETYLTQG